MIYRKTVAKKMNNIFFTLYLLEGVGNIHQVPQEYGFAMYMRLYSPLSYQNPRTDPGSYHFYT